jgi:PAS domain S-box-containing protein
MTKKNTAAGKDPGRQSRPRESRAGRGSPLAPDERSPDALIALSAERAIQSWNAGAAAIYGYSQDEAMGARLADLVSAPELAEETDRVISEAIRSGLAAREATHRRKDGSDIDVDMTARAVRDEDGTVGFIAVSIKDITRHKMRNQSKILEFRYRESLEAVPDALLMVNSTGRVVLANTHAEALFGYRREEILGKPVEALLPERFRSAHVGHRTRYFIAPRARAMGAGLELFACRKDGSEFPVEISLSPLRLDEGTFAICGVRDVTEQKKLHEELRRKNGELEQQNQLIQQANRLKSEFLANMSHELRTPLNGIIGFAEIMHDERVGPISDDHKEYLRDILTSARHLLQLINDILDLSKVEAGKFEFTPRPIDLEMVVAEARDVVRTLAAKRHIKLATSVAPSLTGIVADPRSLKQVLYNFLSNALKFTPEGGEVSVCVTEDDRDFFRLEVRDTGIGIRAEDMGRLFVEFQRLHSGPASQYAGTGLGLALTKRIVEAQGGRVGVESAPGKGSTFYAVLPRVFGSATAARAPQKPAEAAPDAPSILVVEDDPGDREWLAGTLRGAGYAVEAVATGNEALVRCRERRYDAVTLDIMLPDMSGRAVLQKLRERGLNRQTPVVVVTLLPHKGIVAGFQVVDIFSKPVSKRDLLSALERCGVPPDAQQPILVVDDDPSSLWLADEMLRQLGYRTVCQQDAAGALEAAAKQPPAAVVLDLIMPNMDGFEFLSRLRKTRLGREVPVIVWTGKDLSEAERAELRHSASAVTKKSEDAEALLHEIRNILSAPGKAATALH